MIYIHVGDLLKSHCNVIAHQANCMGIMGAGIAKQIASIYPEAYRADREYKIPVGSRERLGRFSYAKVIHQGRTRIVVNLYGQYRYGRGLHTDYEALESAVRSLLKKLQNLKHVKLGMPYGIGCGLAGGDWNIVYPMLSRLSDEYQCDIHLYKLK